jgi:hypothetical protein
MRRSGGWRSFIMRGCKTDAVRSACLLYLSDGVDGVLDIRVESSVTS